MTQKLPYVSESTFVVLCDCDEVLEAHDTMAHLDCPKCGERYVLTHVREVEE
jgi:predicted RNA-binding Zn-ribbon protein involved in translation (DUF1610 family)